MCVMERVEGTESRVIVVYRKKMFELLTEMKVQKAGRIGVYRVNCLCYGASYSYTEQGYSGI